MNKKNLSFALLTLVFVLSFSAGCVQATPAATTAPTEPPAATTQAPAVAPTAAAFPVTFEDALGRSVTLDSAPQRIVVAGKASILIIDALYMFPEAVDRVISYGKGTQTGKNFLSVVDPKIDTKTALENTVSAEQIAPLKPDLVIVKDYLKDSLGTPLETLGIKVVYLNLETPETFYRDVKTIGQIFGDSARADELVAYYQRKVAGDTDALKDLKDSDRPSVLLLQYSAKGGTVAFNVAPQQWLQTDMVKMAGGTPAWLDASNPKGWTTVTLEQIASWKPQMIFIVDYSGNADKVVSDLKNDPQWSELDAVKNQKLFAFASDFLSWDQPDPRWMLGLTWFAAKIQPAAFSSVDINAEVTDFYHTVYMLDENAIKTQVQPIVKAQ